MKCNAVDLGFFCLQDGGFVINNIKPEGSRAGEIRITKEIRVQHTNIERSRVVTSNTSQTSTVILHKWLTLFFVSRNGILQIG